LAARFERRLEATGETRVEFRTPTVDEVDELLRIACRIEDSGWKGEAGTSVVRTTGMYEFLLRQSELLAANGELQVAFLHLDGYPIAFQWLWNVKGVLHGVKVGYDEEFKSLAPGIVLLHDVLRSVFASAPHRCHGYDFHGVGNEMLRRWANDSVAVHFLLAAPPRFVGRTVVKLYSRVRRMPPAQEA
jgi:CelD/BcsL family acetyltransferase involved in cellulose biosynthesis